MNAGADDRFVFADIIYLKCRVLKNFAVPFDENFVRCAHYRVCNANSSAAVELFARNGTQPEPRLRINGVHFKTLHSIGAGKSWKISSFGKTRN